MGKRETQLAFSPAVWAKVRDKKQFVDLLRLGRVANALAFAYPALTINTRYQTPRARRDRTAALFYAGGVAFEGLQVSQSLAKYYRELPQYNAGLGSINSDQNVMELTRTFLKPLRDKVAFHFDRSVYSEALPQMEFSEYRVVTFAAPSPAGVYFDLVDDAIAGFLTKPVDDNDHLQKLEGFMRGTAALCNRLLRGAHKLLPVAFVQLGAVPDRFTRAKLGAT